MKLIAVLMFRTMRFLRRHCSENYYIRLALDANVSVGDVCSDTFSKKTFVKLAIIGMLFQGRMIEEKRSKHA